jgi:hypothetical protein
VFVWLFTNDAMEESVPAILEARMALPSHAGRPCYPSSLIEFYVTAHNEAMPLRRFREPPDEVFFGTGEEVVERLSEAR